MSLDFYPFYLSFKLAIIVTFILLILGIPYAWFLSSTKSRLKPFLEALTALPIVLPPSVLGFYLLFFLSPNAYLGEIVYKLFNIKLVFSFEGLIVASSIYSFPFMIQPIQSGFDGIDKNIIEASYLSGKGRLITLFRVILPNIKSSLLTAIVITFAHTIGEFGVVLMVGGSIPQKTEVASVAIYDYVENLEYTKAHIYSAILLAISFFILFVVYYINHKGKVKNVNG